MSINVRKRDGRKVPFTEESIVVAVRKSDFAVNGKHTPGLAEEVASVVHKQVAALGKTTVKIETVVDFVEALLMDLAPVVGNSYSSFRRQRDIARAKDSAVIKNVNGILNQTDEDQLKENANKNHKVIPTQRDLVAGAVAKQIARDHILPSHIVMAHDNGILHYHDMDYAPAFAMVNCCLVNLEYLFTHGFKMGDARIESPGSISTAAALTAQIIAQVASHIYGGTTIDRIDVVMAPYVTKSYERHMKESRAFVKRMLKRAGVEINGKVLQEAVEEEAMLRTKEETRRAFKGLEYEVNTIHTSNGQTPFVTFGFGRGTSWQSLMIQEAILRNRIRGIGKHGKTPTFPKLVYTLLDGVNRNPEDPGYDMKRLALECTAKRMYPDYLNGEKLIEVTGSLKSPMGCRSFLGPYTNPETGELEHDGRNNLGVCSLNLPRIVMDAGYNKEAFWGLLAERCELIHEALETRIDRLRGVKASIAPILFTEGAFGVSLDPDDEILPIFENGRASISMGYIGLHEVATMLFGEGPADNKEALDFTVKVVAYMRECCDKWKAESGFGYSLYSTPAENLCKRFCELDKKAHGEVKGITDKGYYTNSFHIDVAREMDPFTKYKLESLYPALANGGFISYSELPNMKNNIDGLETILDYTKDKNPYVGFNTPADQCYVCDWEGEALTLAKGYQCPNCGNTDMRKLSVVRRICGYLGASNGINEGKLAEMKLRVKHVGETGHLF